MVNNKPNAKPIARGENPMLAILRIVQIVGLVLVPSRSVFAQESSLRRISPDADSGTSGAIVVDGATGLAHTPMIMPLDAQGNIVGPGRPDDQIAAVLDRLEKSLSGVGAGLEK